MADGTDAWARHMPEELVGKIAAARRHVRKVVLAKGWALVVFAACVSFGVSIILDRFLFLGSPYRLALFVASVGATGSFLMAFVVLPLLRRISARRIARSVEDKHPELGDLLLSAVELSEQLAAGEKYTSRELIGAVSRETARRTKRIDFRSVLPFSAIRKPLLVTLGVVCGLAVYCCFRPMIAGNVLRRVLYPYSGPDPLTFTRLAISPGSVLIPTGTDVEIEATATGKVPEKARLYLERKEGKWKKVTLAREGKGAFRYALKGVVRPLSYRMRAGDARSDTYTILVSDRPVIVGMEVAYTYPDYTRRPPENKTDGGDIAAVMGSQVQITARSNKPLKSATLRFGDGTQSLVSIRGSTIRSQVFEVKKDDSYSFDLVDVDGFSNLDAITHKIRGVEDKSPAVGITSPDRHSDATPDDVVAVDFRAVDDFGIEKMWLEYTVKSGELKEEKDKVPGEERKGVFEIGLGERGKTEIESQHALPLEDVGAKVGEVVVFRIVAEDNNTLSGPGKGMSPDHTIRIISRETSFRKIEQEQQDLTRRLRRLIAQQKENKKLVDGLSRTLEGKESLSEEEKGSLKEAKSSQRQIEEAGRELSNDFEKTLEKMRLNPMIQTRTLIEMGDVTGALQRVSANEMPEATQKASEAAASEEAKGREKRLGETSVLQEEIIRALENVAKEFAQLQDEQKLLSLAETASRLAKEQLAVRSRTAASVPELAGLFPERLTEEQKRKLKKLVEAEEKLQEKLREFEERLRTLYKQLEYAKSSDAQMIRSALDYFERAGDPSRADIPGDVREAINALRANHLHKGMGYETRVYESLMRLAKEFRDAQLARLQGEFANTAERLEGYEPEIDKLIELQKAIIAETEPLPRETAEKAIERTELSKFDKVAGSQKDLLRRTSNFRMILEEIFENLVLLDIDPVTPLKGSEGAMGAAARELGGLKAGAALDQEKDSLLNLEKARDELAKAMARMLASASLQQCMQGMSMLERMILEQRKINEGTLSIDEEATEKKTMTDPMLEALRQLAERQAGLKDTAVSLKDYLKMMLKAGEMMGESTERLRTRQTGQQTQQLQSQILELLMQMLVKLQMNANAMAQAMGMPGSSGTGAHGGIVTPPILRRVPEGLDDRWANLPPRIKRELLEAWAEKFSPEFRELIALYYKRLSGEGSLR